MGILARITQTLSRARDSDSNDTALAYREVHYTDSSGNRTGKIGHHCRMYNATGGVLVLNAAYMVNYSGNPATSPQVIACATSTPTRELVIAKEAIAIASWGWVCYSGWTDALVEGTTDVAVGDFLKLTSGTTATAFIKDGTTITAASHAIAGAAQTANSEVAVLVELFGDRATVA